MSKSDGRKYCKYKIGDLVHLFGERYNCILDIVVKAGYLYYVVYDIREPDKMIEKETMLFEYIVEDNHRKNYAGQIQDR